MAFLHHTGLYHLISMHISHISGPSFSIAGKKEVTPHYIAQGAVAGSLTSNLIYSLLLTSYK